MVRAAMAAEAEVTAAPKIATTEQPAAGDGSAARRDPMSRSEGSRGVLPSLLSSLRPLMPSVGGVSHQWHAKRCSCDLLTRTASGCMRCANIGGGGAVPHLQGLQVYASCGNVAIQPHSVAWNSHSDWVRGHDLRQARVVGALSLVRASRCFVVL